MRSGGNRYTTAKSKPEEEAIGGERGRKERDDWKFGVMSVVVVRMIKVIIVIVAIIMK